MKWESNDILIKKQKFEIGIIIRWRISIGISNRYSPSYLCKLFRTAKHSSHMYKPKEDWPPLGKYFNITKITIATVV